MSVVFCLMLLSGLCSTLDSVLCAASSLAVVDLLRPNGGDMSIGEEGDSANVWKARAAMLATALIGILIASIPGIKILHLFLFYGTLRASTLIPTVLTLTWKPLRSRAVFWAVLISMCCGGPLMVIGNIPPVNYHFQVAGSILVVATGVCVSMIGSKLLNEQRSKSVEN